jgi:hypothetical protein
MGYENFSHFAWWNAFNSGKKNEFRVVAASMMDKEGDLTPIGRALTSDLDNKMADCDRDSIVVDLGNGKKVLDIYGAYFDICTKVYLGHADAAATKAEDPTRKRDKQFDINDVKKN